jgi:hypothetical protein
MDNQTQTVAPMSRLDFAGMTDKKLLAYLKANQVYVSPDDRLATRADMLATANLVADRKAEDFIAARERAEVLNTAVNVTSAKLQEFPRGPLGLTPDEVKASPEWKTAYSSFNTAFQALRKFNGPYAKRFADELRHERNTVRAARLAAFA